jgi:hypothetical protein
MKLISKESFKRLLTSEKVTDGLKNESELT